MAAPATIWPAAVSERSAGVLARAPRRARVLAAFPTALYLQVGDTMLPLVGPTGLRLPTAVCVAPDRPTVAWGVQPGDEVLVGADEIRLPQAVVRSVRTWRPSPVPIATAPTLLPVGTPFSPTWHEPAVRLVGALLAGAPVSPLVAALVGAGPGLTPSGDDVLCGALLGLRLGGRTDTLVPPLWAAVEPLLGTTTTLSGSLLAEAAEGYAVEPVVRLCEALAAGDRARVAAGVERVLAIGHTSGADLLAGLAGCLEALADTMIRPTSMQGALL